MRMPGWCTKHRRFEQVRVSTITARMAFGGLAEGLCAQAEDEEAAASRRSADSLRRLSKRGRPNVAEHARRSVQGTAEAGERHGAVGHALRDPTTAHGLVGRLASRALRKVWR